MADDHDNSGVVLLEKRADGSYIYCSRSDYEAARQIIGQLKAERRAKPAVVRDAERRKQAAEAIEEARELDSEEQISIGEALVRDAKRRAAKAEGKGKVLSLQANNQPTVPAGAAASPNRTKARRKQAIEKLAAFAEESRELRGPAIEAQRQRLVEECRRVGCDRQLVASLARAARTTSGRRIQRQRKESNR